jgi:hypothetical protein
MNTNKPPTAEPLDSTDWLEVLAKILRCFGDMEGTWYQGDWKSYGVTPEQEAMIEAAVARQESTSNAFFTNPSPSTEKTNEQP